MVTGRFVRSLIYLVVLAGAGMLLWNYTAVVLVFAAALAVKHMAYILINGNVFQEVRTYFDLRSQHSRTAAGRKVMRKLYVLFSCNLCMTAQLSIWTIAVPTAVVAHYRFGNAVEHYVGTDLPPALEWLVGVGATFLFAMVVAALAMIWWRVAEFPQEYIQAQMALREQELELARAKLAAGKQIIGGIVGLTEADVMSVLEQVHAACVRDSFCRIVLRECFARHLPRIVKELGGRKGWESQGEQVFLSWFKPVAEQYVQEMYKEYSDPARYERIRTNLAREFIAALAYA
jgi:hypothetical protein